MSNTSPRNFAAASKQFRWLNLSVLLPWIRRPSIVFSNERCTSSRPKYCRTCRLANCGTKLKKWPASKTPEPMPPKRRGRPPRAKPSMPDPVSIIPDTDPVTAGSVPNFPGQPSPSCRHDGEGQPTNSDPALEPVTQPMACEPQLTIGRARSVSCCKRGAGSHYPRFRRMAHLLPRLAGAISRRSGEDRTRRHDPLECGSAGAQCMRRDHRRAAAGFGSLSEPS